MSNKAVIQQSDLIAGFAINLDTTPPSGERPGSSSSAAAPAISWRVSGHVFDVITALVQTILPAAD